MNPTSPIASLTACLDGFVHDLFDIGRLQVADRFADHVAELVLVPYRSVKSVLMQSSPRRIALLADRPSGGVELHPAPYPKFFPGLFGHIVRRMVRDEQFVGYGFDILGKGRPRLVETRPSSRPVAVPLFIGGVPGPAVVFLRADAGDRDGVDAVVYMIYALFAGVFFLQSPHFTESVGRGTFDDIDPPENRFQVEPCILPDDPDIDPLPVAETFRDFGHGEPFVFSAPVIALHAQVVAPLDGAVPFLFRGGVSPLSELGLDLFLQRFDLFPPSETFDPFQDFGTVRQFGGQFRPFAFPVETAFAKRFVHLRIVAAAGARQCMFDVETRSRSDKVRNSA